MMQVQSIVRVALSLALLSCVGGCNAFGPIGAVVAHAIPRTREAAYKKLAHQTVGVMCWADQGIRADNNYIQIDIAAGVEQKLKAKQATDKPKCLEGATFPIAPTVIAQYQEDHPEIEGLPITETAAKFNLTRLVYIEVTQFATRSAASLQLYRGTLTGNLQVVEISKTGVAKVAYRENDIKISFPKDTPTDGLPNGNDYKIYTGTIDKFTTEIVHRLAPYEEDPDAIGPPPGL